MRQARVPADSTAALLLGLAALAAGAPACGAPASGPAMDRPALRELAPAASAPTACALPGCDGWLAGRGEAAPTSFAALSAPPPETPGPPAATSEPESGRARYGLPALLAATLGLVAFIGFRRTAERPLRPTRPSS